MSGSDSSSGIYSEEPFSPKGVVSFVLDGSDKNHKGMELNDEEYKQCEIEQDKRRARYSATIFLSVLYAIVLILIGVVFPVTEALLDQWRTSGVVAAFLLYMSGGSVIFLTYLLIIIEMRSRKAKEQRRNPSLNHKPTSTENQTPFQTNVASYHNEAFKSDKLQNGEFILLSPIPDHSKRERSISTSSSVNSRKLKDENGRVENQCNTENQASVLGEIANEHGQVENQCNTENQASVLCEIEDNNSTFDDGSTLSGNESEEVMKFISINTRTGSQAHEGTSFYLRFGFLLFAIAYILFLSLEIDYFYADNGCDQNNKYAWVLFFHLAFVIVQTFFLFKHQKLDHVKEGKRILRFGLMHVVATNLVVWLRAMVSEIREGIHSANPDDHSLAIGSVEGLHNDSSNDTDCSHEVVINASHYLFPFILEYSLIAVAIFLGMFTSLDIRVNGEVLQSIKRYIRRAKRENNVHQPHGEAISLLDKAHTGLYIGILFLTGAIISFIIIQFKLSNSLAEPDLEEDAEVVYFCTDLTLTFFALVGCIVGIAKMRYLRISFLRSQTVDVLLLLLSLIGLLLYSFFKTICIFYTITNQEATVSLILNATSGLLIEFQVLIQTIFITAGLKVYSDKEEDRINKPGRGAITFLILINISIWFLKSFAEKDIADHIMENFYGITPWQIILHSTLPLMLFYRFHSSVCLADMWLSAYENENSPLDFVDLS